MLPDTGPTCGLDGQSCCIGSACYGGLVCTLGTCGPAPVDAGVDAYVTCGMAAQACCVGSTCSGGLVCTSGVCGAPVDAGSTPCGLFPFMACCPGNVCYLGMVCTLGVCLPS
jgi:hypothetical protein